MLTFFKTTFLTGILALGGLFGLVQEPAADFPPLPAQADEPLPEPDPLTEGQREALRAFWQGKRPEIGAAALVMTVEEFAAAQEQGESLRALFAASGLTREEVRENLRAGIDAALVEAEAEGLLSAEQAERIRENPRRLRTMARFWPLRVERVRSAALEELASILGVPVEELQEARAAGSSLTDLAAEAGLEPAEVRTQLRQTYVERVLDGVASGRPTPEQGRRLLERGLRPGPNP